MVQVLEATPYIAMNRAVIWLDEQERTFLLAMEGAGRGQPECSRVLDEFSSLGEAREMLILCADWLGSDELTHAYIENSEDAIINSWQDYAFRAEDKIQQVRREFEAMTSIPGFGVF